SLHCNTIRSLHEALPISPALKGGNTIVLKHASNVPRCALAIDEAFASAGVPAGVTATLLVGSAEVAELIADPRIAAVTLTGSDRSEENTSELKSPDHLVC